MSSELAGQQVIILREGTSRSRGQDALKANIMAAKIIAESVRSSLGPKGMDKMLVDGFGDVTITNDGATILDEMEVQHPAAKMMVEVAKTQDDEVGDGTTTSVVVAGELLKKAEELLDQGIHPTVIVDGYREASNKALEVLNQIAIKIEPNDKALLRKVAEVSLASKILAEDKEAMAELAVNAILQVAEKTSDGYKVDIDDVKVEKKPGESLTDTSLIKGIVLDKEIVHPGMPKRVEDAKIALVDAPLEVEKTEFDAKINIENPEQMKAFLDEEEKMLKEMTDKISNSGANVLLCEKGIDDVAQHYLAKKGILAVRRVKQSDMEKLVKATGGKVVSNVNDLRPEDLGFAKLVEERKVADDKMTFVEGSKNPKAVTILVRGGSERLVDEAERAIHDALCVVRDVVLDPRVVGGGGAPEAEVARRLREHAQKLSGKEQLAVIAFGEALETLPTALAENAGLDPIDILVQLRVAHEKGQLWAGVDVNEAKVADLKERGILEPIGVKIQVIKSASEAAGMILKIDDVIAAAKSSPGGQGGPKGKDEGDDEGSSDY
ncbi:MAG: thermosome subunit [Crenarchaeota archaeon 13_1_40CM_2_52_14]|nr:MAG: thermosome subunit [Crenarchaeota archaeon 13_1_40CM_3_52_17]OLD34957.1 MAG: thermosome subunit [Crenarchaeota archaeon 13_1_40CM_2_52_14]